MLYYRDEYCRFLSFQVIPIIFCREVTDEDGAARERDSERTVHVGPVMMARLLADGCINYGKTMAAAHWQHCHGGNDTVAGVFKHLISAP